MFHQTIVRFDVGKLDAPMSNVVFDTDANALVYVQHFKTNLRDIRSGYPALHK
jgi:glutathionyl-hydroquinone reductase